MDGIEDNNNTLSGVNTIYDDFIFCGTGRFDYLTVGGVNITSSGTGVGIPGPTGPIGLMGAQGMTGPTGFAGVSFRWMGTYLSTITYLVNDVVQYSGSSYICILSSIGYNPTNTTFWNLLAAQGDQGLRGAQGAAGSNGSNGSDGAQGDMGPTGDQGPPGPIVSLGDVINALLTAGVFATLQSQVLDLGSAVVLLQDEYAAQQIEIGTLDTKTLYQSTGMDGIHTITNFNSDLLVGASSHIKLSAGGTSVFECHIDNTGYDLKTRNITCENIVGNIPSLDNPTLNIGRDSGVNNVINIGSGIKNTNLTLDGDNIYIGSASTTNLQCESSVVSLLGASNALIGTNTSYRNNTTTSITDVATSAITLSSPYITIGSSTSVVSIPGIIYAPGLNLSSSLGFLSQF